MCPKSKMVYFLPRRTSHDHITKLRQETVYLNPLPGLYNETFSFWKKKRNLLISTLPKDYMH